ncbi:MAG: ATP-binding protein [Deltaproteobacteria bacterium]
MSQERQARQVNKQDVAMPFSSINVSDPDVLRGLLTKSGINYWFTDDCRSGIYGCCDPDLKVTFVNDVWARSLNKQPHELVGSNALELIAPEVHPYLIRVLGHLNPSFPVCVLELELDAKAATWARWTIRAVYHGPMLVEYQGSFEDISDIKQREVRLNQDRLELEAVVESRTAELQKEIARRQMMEEELLRKNKLESLSILASGIAHDFNNILTIISGNNSLAGIILEEKGDYEVQELLDEVQRGVMQARELTEQLMTFSRGGVPIKEASSIETLVREVAGFVLRGSNVRAVFSNSGQIWPVDIDRGQIGQVFQNLILNAAQSMPGGGNIEIYLSNIMSETVAALTMAEGRYVQIVVKDHGTGISREDLGNIFVPYFSTKEKGHGLGLAMAYSIVNKHNGMIKVSSELGVGTTFEIYLPASESMIIEKNNIVRVNISGQGRILVMDDDRVVRGTLGRMLRQLGYEADLSNEGRETIQMYMEAKQAGNPYHAVILDLTVPGGMGAQETLQRLLKLDDKTKAIVSSGYSSDEVLVNHRHHGFCGAIEKPFEIDRLSQVLFEALGQYKD